jgi:hypothetical protein
MELPKLLELIDDYCELKSDGLYCKKAYHKRPLGKFATHEAASGHLVVSIKGQHVMLHRVIFYILYGWMPEYVDHIDRNPKNNNPENLRAASKATNSWNRDVQSNSTTGLRGVHYNKNPDSVCKWGAHIKVNGKREWLGSYMTAEEASNAYENAYNKYVASGDIVP